ncbi:hypothetical protein [Komagataeibacter europaeus]|uniref:hypothetical protein n=1 Tax=Komagataeibacter europaeus TaxID=33995 RepID=UPI000B3EB5D9|nr:hypothetical protein [Komagataeibacter europaeus]ARW16424.1 hypothetical protein S101446_01293 [Komagataeibacter europaeus]
MIENLPLEALRLAREMTPVQPNGRMQLEAIFKVASALSQALFSGDFSLCIDNLDCLFEERQKIVSSNTVSFYEYPQTGVGGDGMSFLKGNIGRNCENKSFTGGRNDSHKVSSSVQDGESGKEVTTPSRAETVATSGDAALQPGTHGTGEGA